jgi:CMP-N-acetylneuraminic acid synthetase
VRGFETLAVIPARGGSKGIPRKNLADICGKPLVAYAIEAARRAAWISRVVVSTDDPEIAEAAVRHGAEVPFLRPRDMAGDSALIGSAIQHILGALRRQEGYACDCVCILLPTSPFRPAAFLDRMVSRIAEGYRNAYAVKRLAVGRHTFLAEDGDGYLPLAGDTTLREGAVSNAFRRYGVCVAQNLTGLDNGLDWAEEIDDPAMLLDIDSHEDLEVARLAVQRGRFAFA